MHLGGYLLYTGDTMKELKAPSENEQYIAVLTARQNVGTSFENILSYVIKALDFVQYDYPDTNQFTFIIDGTRGSSEVIGAINIVQTSMNGYKDKSATRRKFDLDVELYGPKAREEWLKKVLETDPAVVLILDDQHDTFLTKAQKMCETVGTETMVRKVKYIEPKTIVR